VKGREEKGVLPLYSILLHCIALLGVDRGHGKPKEGRNEAMEKSSTLLYLTLP
jgi:hypothetical protein